ncbi:member of the phosphate permease [Scheffersomyces spartinae]|uniref:Member of the phosphate permease n=1 Tax=Scheffersomyces spartinae TaxID=45513 RepID=A0A9P7V6N7_9ASCO|nr:member of the phosphate permease [Scheffersomyces spartinae]KAG7192368.1 member of the phosphate permease [Scheffersomyces spartinae]
MKFSHSLTFNAVPEWQQDYLNYDGLKKLIYQIQEQVYEQFAGPEGQNISTTTISDLVNEAQAQLKKDLDSAASSSDNAKTTSESSGNAFSSDAEKTKVISKQKWSKISALLKRNKPQEHHDLEKGIDSIKNKGSEAESDTYSVALFSPSGGSHGLPVDFTDTLVMAAIVEELLESISDVKPTLNNGYVLRAFAVQLLPELSKVSNFFESKYLELSLDYDNLFKDIEKMNIQYAPFGAELGDNGLGGAVIGRRQLRGSNRRRSSVFETINHLDRKLTRRSSNASKKLNGKNPIESAIVSDDEDDSDIDDFEVSKHSLLTDNDFDETVQKQVTLKKKSVLLFISLNELKSFIELNKIGFTKICKKFDKTMNYKIKEEFVTQFISNYSMFQSATINSLSFKINQVVSAYASLSETSKDAASTELKSYLRDHIVWERNTVWKEMLSLEKKTFNIEPNTQAVNLDDDILNIEWTRIKFIPFPVPKSLLTSQTIKLIIIIIVFSVLMAVKTFKDPVQGRALAVLVASAMLWASEALPLFVTSMLVPLLVVTCKVLKNKDGTVMYGQDASQYILGVMWSSVIMLLIGGFTLAAALSKYNVAKVISSFILALAGTDPRIILLAIMCVSVFLSMWISNVAAPVLAFSLIQPILRSLPTTNPFSKALVLGIALASNMAGMASPISSPQNMIAIEAMTPNPGWGNWFAVALPVCIFGTILIWLELILVFDIKSVKIKAFKPIKDRFTVKQWFVSIVSFVTIILWCTLTKTELTWGELGIISCIPVVLFFGTGLLRIDDLNNFPWSIVLLAMGGQALGKAITSSGLLKTIAIALQHKIEDFPLFAIFAIFGILVLVVATFVSHTVAALIVVPLVKEVGENLPQPHPLILIMGTALMASAAMGLPTSGFPNVTAISMTDEVRKRYLTVNLFITVGVPASLLAFLAVLSLGFGVMHGIGF